MSELTVYVVNCEGSVYGVFSVDPEPYLHLFAEETGYDIDDFYVDSYPLQGTPTLDNIGLVY